MPTYEYLCKECGHNFDAVQSFQDDALTECPVCSGKLRKVFGNVGIAFKGSGFYKTDSRTSGGSSSSKSSSDSSKSTDTSTSASGSGDKKSSSDSGSSNSSDSSSASKSDSSSSSKPAKPAGDKAKAAT